MFIQCWFPISPRDPVHFYKDKPKEESATEKQEWQWLNDKVLENI